MATIPQLTARRSLDPGSPVQYSGESPVGAALDRAGKTGMELALHYQQNTQKIETIKANQDTEVFDTTMRGDLTRRTAEMPEGGVGFAKGFMEDYERRLEEFLAKQPEHLRQQIADRLNGYRARVNEIAVTAEHTAGQNFQRTAASNKAQGAQAGVLQAGAAGIDLVPEYMRDIEEIFKSGNLPKDEQRALIEKYKKDLVEAGFLAQPPDERQRIASGWGTSRAGHAGNASMHPIIDAAAKNNGIDPGFMRRIAKIESGGDPRAVTGSYKGLFQMSDAEFAKFGGGNIMDPTDNANAAARKIAAEVREFTTRNGRAPSPTEIYLQHQQGVGGLAAHLANPDRPAWQNMASTGEGRQKGAGWAKQAIWGNIPDTLKAQFPGGVDSVTSADFVRLWKGKVEGGGEGDARFAAIPPEKRVTLGAQADVAVNQQVAQQSVQERQIYQNRLNEMQTGIIDNKVTAADVQQARDEGWLKDADHINGLLHQIASRDKATADVQGFYQKLATPGASWNPLDKKDQDGADAAFRAVGGDLESLQTIANETGIVPKSAAVTVRGMILSGDPKKVQQALQVAGNLVGGQHPNIFAGVDGEKDITTVANTFRHYVYGRGMTAEEATRRIMEQRTPEYQQKVTARYKPEDVKELAKKSLGVDDIRGAFDPSFLGIMPNPQLAFNPDMRARALGDYEEAFRDAFMTGATAGDVSASKNAALAEMRITWGVTAINGKQVVMKYPPERSPAYQGVQNVSDHIAIQAQADIKEWSGADVPRGNIRIDEVRSTAERYVRGQPPTYQLSFVDKKGVLQIVPQPFFAQREKMIEAQTADRAGRSAQIQQRVQADALLEEENRVNRYLGFR